MNIRIMELEDLIKKLYNLIEQEFLLRNPNYYESKPVGILINMNPLTVVFEFSNTFKKDVKPNIYQFELQKYDDIDLIKQNLKHRAKLNYNDKVEDKEKKIYFTMELF